MSMFRRFAPLLLASALPFAALAEGETPAAAPANLPAISVVAAESSRLTDRVIASGLIGAVETIFVQPQIEGQAIDEILVDVGDDVVQGQLLARLSDTALQLQKSQLEASMASVEAQIAQARAQITDAETARNESMKQWDRTEKLLANGNVSEAAADQVKAAATSADVRLTVSRQGLLSAQAQLKVVEAQMADVDLRLLRTNVIAPVAGKITAKNAMVGAIASGAGQPLFVIAREGRLELIADIAEIDILKLQPDQKAVMEVVGLAEPITGTVRLVEPTLNTATRLGRVKIALDDSSAVREGMFAEADITTAERDTLVVPVSAVGGSADAPTVFKVTDGKVIQTAVKTGIRDGGLIEIVEGLAKGDLVVAKAGAFVRDGDRVNPVVIKNDLLAGH
jgi:HlyD family secretion protein